MRQRAMHKQYRTKTEKNRGTQCDKLKYKHVCCNLEHNESPWQLINNMQTGTKADGNKEKHKNHENEIKAKLNIMVT